MVPITSPVPEQTHLRPKLLKTERKTRKNLTNIKYFFIFQNAGPAPSPLGQLPPEGMPSGHMPPNFFPVSFYFIFFLQKLLLYDFL